MAEHFSIPQSGLIRGFEWCGERIPYPEPHIKGDTFPMTWASDGEIYASAGDPGWEMTPDGPGDERLAPVSYAPYPGSPGWGESFTGLDVEKFSGGPTDYRIEKIHHMNDYVGWGGDGPKPTGMICVDGVLYLAFQNLLRMRQSPHSLRSQCGADSQIVYASLGLARYAWTPAISTIKEPMFPGYVFGGPAFINFGKNNENARDDHIYAVSTDQWDNGSNLRLGRAPADSIPRAGAWQWVCAWTPSGEPVWGYDLYGSIPILSLHKWISLPDMVYLAGIKRYLLLTWHLHMDFDFANGAALLIFEAPEPWGPFSLVHYEDIWESREFAPYCPRLPLKWMEPDGRSGWLQFSGKPGSPEYYRSNVRPFRLVMR